METRKEEKKKGKKPLKKRTQRIPDTCNYNGITIKCIYKMAIDLISDSTVVAFSVGCAHQISIYSLVIAFNLIRFLYAFKFPSHSFAIPISKPFSNCENMYTSTQPMLFTHKPSFIHHKIHYANKLFNFL